MNILAFVNKNSSPAYHRIILPLDLMDEGNIIISNDLHTSHFMSTGLFVYNHVIPETAAKGVYDCRKHYGFKIGIDVDDYWILDSTHPYLAEYKQKNIARLQVEQLMSADFVTVTHERLVKKIKPYNKNIHILPNSIPQAEQFIEVKKVAHPTGLTRLFWQGSNTHLADVAELIEPLVKLELSQYANDIEMVLGGYQNNVLWNEVANAYTSRGKLKHSLIAPLHYEYYYHLYCEADICLIPLRKTLFNSMKSNLKVLEAANMKLPVIASNVNPYLNLPIRYASNAANWFLHIKDLLKYPNKQKEEGETLHAYCAEHFNFNKINNERKQIYKHYSN